MKPILFVCIDGGTTLSCGVTVDDVHAIAIEHTTKILYVDAAPAPITAVAYNSDGNTYKCESNSKILAYHSSLILFVYGRPNCTITHV